MPARKKSTHKSDDESEPEPVKKSKRQLKGPSGRRPKTATNSKPASTTKSSPKTQTKSKPKKATTAQSKSPDSDESRGFYESESDALDSEGNPIAIKKRKSRRLKTVRDREAEEAEQTDSEEEEDKTATASNRSKNKNRRKRRLSENNASSPPKKKAKTSRNTASENMVQSPYFVTDTEYLLEIGIAHKKKRRILHRKEYEFNGHTFRWHQNQKYKLKAIVGHTLEVDQDETLMNYPSEQVWWKSLDWKSVKQRMDKNGDEQEDKDGNDDGKKKDKDNKGKKAKNGHNKQEEEEMPQAHLGVLLFDCEWEDWGESTNERWETIKHTRLFETYCEQQGWKPYNELIATIQEHSPEHFKQIVSNLAVFGTFKDRRGLKIVCNTNLNKAW